MKNKKVKILAFDTFRPLSVELSRKLWEIAEIRWRTIQKAYITQSILKKYIKTEWKIKKIINRPYTMWNIENFPHL
jgi:hypothetical protein